MTQYFLDIHGNLNLSDCSQVDDYIKVLKEKDEIVINIDSNKKIDSQILNMILKSNNFNIVEKGGRKENGTYYIKAFRN